MNSRPLVYKTSALTPAPKLGNNSLLRGGKKEGKGGEGGEKKRKEKERKKGEKGEKERTKGEKGEREGNERNLGHKLQKNISLHKKQIKT